MNFTVIREHREFFKKHHWIECDGVISKTELKRFTDAIPSIISERSKSWDSASEPKAEKKEFVLGHDIWRGSVNLKKTILSRSLAGIAGELIEEKPLRFGYDTLFPPVSNRPEKNVYESFLQTSPTLQEMSAIQGVLCGAMVCISGNNEVTEESAGSTIFSKTPGNVVFFSPDWSLPLNEIYQNPSCLYLLIVYVKANAIYLAQKGDPHLHEFKRLGYNFGDRLREPIHPIVYV